MMPEIYFSNYRLEEDTHYFLYIGELKNYGLNVFLKNALSRIHGRKLDFICIVPDVFEQYNYENLLVLNPDVYNYTGQYGRTVSCRIPANIFYSHISESPPVRALIKKLLRRQDRLYVYMYESLPQMTLDAIPGVVVLGPKSRTAYRLNSKIYQYKNLKNQVPMIDFRICKGLDEVLRATDTLWSQWKDGIFISREYSAAGSNSIIAKDAQDIVRRFQEKDAVYFISRYIPHDKDPTVLAVVANQKDVYVAGVADQRIENGTRFTGSTFPTRLPENTVADLKTLTRVVGRWLGKEGYRGIFGCDFLVDEQWNIFFLEVNARKQGTTMEFCCTLEQSLPPGSPMLPELEYYAFAEGRFPENAVEMEKNLKNIHWGTYNYKIDASVCTNGYIPQNSNEREAFKKVASNNLKKDFLIFEHIGNDFVVAQGSFLARIVALGHDHPSVEQGLKLGRKTIELTI
ncbi:MAG: ATP-grasp domain-containing protein, partial [Proteobacteria bacterium]|nr:ATP-grasp domain-containing protein [Pseudomonadota bacterium]